MGKIIDYQDIKNRRRRKISVVKEDENKIVVYGRYGKIFIYLINETKRRNKFRNKFIEYIKNILKLKKKYCGQEIKIISQKDCRELLFSDIKKISLNNISLYKQTKVWEQLQEQLLNARFFKFVCLYSETCTESYYFTIDTDDL